MATWLILVMAAIVLAVIGATTAATWLLGVGLLVLVVGIFWAVTGRQGHDGATVPHPRSTRGGGR